MLTSCALASATSCLIALRYTTMQDAAHLLLLPLDTESFHDTSLSTSICYRCASIQSQEVIKYSSFDCLFFGSLKSPLTEKPCL